MGEGGGFFTRDGGAGTCRQTEGLADKERDNVARIQNVRNEPERAGGGVWWSQPDWLLALGGHCEDS